MHAPQAMARLWRVAHFVLTDFLELSLEEMPARLTAYPPGIPATAPSALTASMHLGVLPEQVVIPLQSPVCRAARLLSHDPNFFQQQISSQGDRVQHKAGYTLFAYASLLCRYSVLNDSKNVVVDS